MSALIVIIATGVLFVTGIISMAALGSEQLAFALTIAGGLVLLIESGFAFFGRREW